MTVQWWTPKPDHSGYIQARFRVLPNSDNTPAQFIDCAHNLRLPNRELVRVACNDPDDCRLCNLVRDLAKPGASDREIELAQRLYSDYSIISNVLVIDDITNANNNGHVMLYRCDLELNVTIDRELARHGYSRGESWLTPRDSLIDYQAYSRGESFLAIRDSIIRYDVVMDAYPEGVWWNYDDSRLVPQQSIPQTWIDRINDCRPFLQNRAAARQFNDVELDKLVNMMIIAYG